MTGLSGSIEHRKKLGREQACVAKGELDKTLGRLCGTLAQGGDDGIGRERGPCRTNADIVGGDLIPTLLQALRQPFPCDVRHGRGLVELAGLVVPRRAPQGCVVIAGGRAPGIANGLGRYGKTFLARMCN